MIGAVSSVLNTNQSYSDDVIKTTMATLTETTGAPNRLVYKPSSDSSLPIPAKLQGKLIHFLTVAGPRALFWCQMANFHSAYTLISAGYPR